MQSSSQPEARQAAGDGRWRLIGPAMRVVAEAGFFTVLYAAVSVTLEGRPPLLGPIEFFLLVGLGALVGTFAQDNPEFGAPALVFAVVGGGIASWLANEDARALLSISFGGALVTHGIGWIGAFAVLRGSFIHGTKGSAMDMEPLLRTLLPIVAGLWAFAIFISAPSLRPSFAAFALWGSLAVIVAGLTGIGFVRLHELHSAVSDKGVRRMWRWVVLAIAISVVPLAMPFAVLSGIPVDILLRPLTGPLHVLVDLLIIPFSLLVDLLVILLKPIAGPVGAFIDQLANGIAQRRRSPDPIEPTLVSTLAGLILASIVLAVLAIAAYLLARWLLARPLDKQRLKTPSEGVIEHDIVVPEPPPPRVRATRPRRVAAHDAVTAYVTAVEDLAANPTFARAVAETPAEHSLRVRRAAMPGATDLSRLAADYQLARYAERLITPREDRRALSRLDRLRRALRGG